MPGTSLGLISQAVGLFAVTNVDDIVVLALFFAQGAGHKGTVRAVVIGQYLGFVATLVVAVAAALGATLLPAKAIPYLGLLPLALGIKAAVESWMHRADEDDDAEAGAGGPRIVTVAAVTFANGGDNVGVYVPVFATAGIGGMSDYVVVFLVLLAGLIAAGRFFATRPVIARTLSRWGHVLLPVVLVGVGVVIVVGGGAFGF